MSISFKDFLKYFFPKKESYEELDVINRSIFRSTMTKMYLIATATGLIGLAAFIVSFSAVHASKPYIIHYRYIYILLFILMVVHDAAFLFINRDYDARYKILTWLLPVMAFMTFIWSVFATCVNAYALGFANPCLFIVVSLLVPIGMYMRPPVYMIVAGVADTVMLIAYGYVKTDVTAPSPKTGVVAIILLLNMVFALMLYLLQYTIRINSLTFERQKKEIDDLNSAQNRFFSSMSHEIRTPINTIIGLNEMILREDVSDEVAEDAANIRAASNMLLHLINDILDMSKISSGQMKLTNVSYRPGDMLSELVGMLWHRAKEKGIDLHIEVAPDIPSELYADEVRIKQVLINVLNNAIKYTDKGSVTLSIQCNGISEGKADIVYSVKDTGIGIRKESIPHLFTAFKRIDEEKNRYIEGTGLGLSIVKELTDLMGGSVSVNSVYKQGSTFLIEIPQTVTDYSAIGRLDLEEKHKENMSGRYRCTFTAECANVLVVDDNVSNLMVMRKLLRDTKIHIDTAESGARALEMTLENTYDVIFMDHLMPEMDGVECFRRIRNQVGGVSKDSKVIALTANAGSEMRKLYSDEGFDGYLVKPVNTNELEGELLRLLPKDKVTLNEDNANIIENSVLWMDDHKKKRAIAITTESVADIPRVLLDKYNIMTIRHKVETKDGVFSDGGEVDAEGLLDYMKDNDFVKTHTPTVKEHEEFFAQALTGANNIIHLTVSTRVNHSGYDNACEGAAAFDNVTVFDTRHLSSGQGILVIEACRLAAEGLSVSEIVNRLTVMRDMVHTNFIVDNLDHLARSGQVSPRIASLFRAIMCHPVLNMKNGKLSTMQFYFGTKIRAWNRYISSCLANETVIDRKVLYITYVGLTKKELDIIKELVDKKVTFEKVYIQKASPAIAVNCGPGTFGLLYMKKD